MVVPNLPPELMAMMGMPAAPGAAPPGPMPPSGPMGVTPGPGAIGMPPGDPAMMAMGGMPPMGLPGFPPGVMPDPNYPGSVPVQDAELMLAMQDPEVAQALINLLIQEIDPDEGPKRPPWYNDDDYPKPKPNDIADKVEQDHRDYSRLIDRMRRDRDRIRMAVVGAFKDHDSENEVTFQDASLAIDVQLITSILAAADLIFWKSAKKAGKADDAQKIENLCYAITEQAAARYHAMTGMDWKTDLIKTALSTGHLVSRVLPRLDADEGEVPVNIDLLDPATCYPTWDEYGLETMTRLYRLDVTRVFRGFRLDKKQQKKVLDKRAKNKDGTYRPRSITDTVEVKEYWDRRWYALTVDDDVIIGPVEHDMGKVPFRVTRSAIGDPGNVYEHNLHVDGGTENFMQMDLVNKGQSHIQLLQKTHEQREAIMGIFATEVKKIRNPPRTFEQAITVYGDAPEISNAEGMVNMLRMGEEVEVPSQPDPRFSLMGPLIATVNESAQMGRMSPSDYGLQPGSQSSGAVVEGLSESSKDKLNLWKIMVQNHVAAVLEDALGCLRDHGKKLGPEGHRGEPYEIELQHPIEGKEGYFEFDYRILRESSCHVRVQLTSLRMQNLGQLGNAIQMWDSMGRMTDEEALSLRGVRDPEAYMRKVEIEQFKKTPEFKTARLIEWMKEEEMFEELPTVLYLLATQGGSGGGPPGGGGQAGAMPGNGGPPPPAGMPGGPGQQGGRPPQLPGPPPSITASGGDEPNI